MRSSRGLAILSRVIAVSLLVLVGGAWADISVTFLDQDDDIPVLALIKTDCSTLRRI
jgi:hypothetical protein